MAIPAGLQFLTPSAYIVKVIRACPGDYGDKRLCNKQPGPGGGTRRLHHKPSKAIGGGGFLWGRNRIDGCVKAVLLTGKVQPSSDYCLGANDNEMALAA